VDSGGAPVGLDVRDHVPREHDDVEAVGQGELGEVGEVGDDPAQFGGLGPGHVDHVGVVVDPDDGDAAVSEFDRDASGAAPGVEHRPRLVGLYESDLAVRIDPGRREPLPALLVAVDVETVAPRRPVGRQGVGHAQSHTAPRAAVPTSFAYFASTPRLCLGAGADQAALRRASSSPSTCRSRVRAAMSSTISSPSRTSAIGPPSVASGATWPMHRPVVAPENRPSVRRSTSLPIPAPLIAPVTASISRMPGPPRGPSLRMTTTSPSRICPPCTAAIAASSPS